MNLKCGTAFVVTIVTIFTGTVTRAGPTLMLLTNTEFNGLQTGVKELDQGTGAILGFLVEEDWPNNGNLWPIETMAAGPNRTLLFGSSSDDTIKKYDEFGNFVGVFVSGEPVNNIRGMARSPDGNFLFTSDWRHDDIHRFNFFTGAPAPIAGDPDGQFIAGGQPLPGLDLPQAIAVLSTGELLIADLVQKKLLKYNSSTGQLIGPFIQNPLEDLTGATVRDIDVLDNGDVVVSVSGSGNQIRTYSSGGALDPSRTFSFRGPAGVHVLPNGEFLVTSATTFDQGQGLFRVAPNGTILETIDNSRAYGALELITLVDAVPGCGGGVGDGDVNQDGSTNGGDISLFVDIMLNGTFLPGDPEFCAADVNPDDLVNQDDVAPFVQVVIGP